MMCKLLLVLFALFAPSTLSMEQSAVDITNANNLFTRDLYRALLGEKDKENFVFSPLGVHTVLSMLYQGAESTTKGALQTSLHLKEPDAVADGYSHVITNMNNVKNITLYTANKVYVNTQFNLLPEFKDIVKDKFQSSVENIEFKDSPAAAGEINNWVNNKTMGKIPLLFKDDDFTEDTGLVLLNAIYFKGAWKDAFRKESTLQDDFYVDETTSVKVDMMTKKSGFNHKFDPDLEASVLEIPFQSNGVSLFVVLPRETNGMATTESKIDQYGINKVFEGLSWTKEVQLHLPKFKLETEINLERPLASVGVGILFDRTDCNLRKMLDIDPSFNLYIDKAIQKTFFEVNEEGAEAAAATGVRGFTLFGKTTSVSYVTFYVDHPFLLMLRRFNNTLFYGKVVNPLVKQVIVEDNSATGKLQRSQQLRSESNRIIVHKMKFLVVSILYCVLFSSFL